MFQSIFVGRQDPNKVVASMEACSKALVVALSCCAVSSCAPSSDTGFVTVTPKIAIPSGTKAYRVGIYVGKVRSSLSSDKDVQVALAMRTYMLQSNDEVFYVPPAGRESGFFWFRTSRDPYSYGQTATNGCSFKAQIADPETARALRVELSK
jgi:hypothetical protein